MNSGSLDSRGLLASYGSLLQRGFAQQLWLACNLWVSSAAWLACVLWIPLNNWLACFKWFSFCPRGSPGRRAEGRQPGIQFSALVDGLDVVLGRWVTEGL
jgi:hypothetical protein